MHSASRDILYTPPPAADDDRDETERADEIDSAAGAGTSRDGPSGEDREEATVPPADD